MKKITVLLLILSLVLCLSACSACGKADTPSEIQEEPAADSIQSNDTETVKSIPLLEGYPEDVLPLYQSLRVTGCSFTCRVDPGYIIGKDFYTVDYTSEASLKEISEYYQSLLTREEEYSEEDFLQGDIGDHHVFISITEDYDGECMHVGLTVGLAENEYVAENPFFADLPDDLVESKGMRRLQETSYIHTNYSVDEVRYLTIYETDLSEEDFMVFYQEKYANMSGFTERRDDYGLTYGWEDQGYDCHVTYSPGDYTFVTIEINPIIL